MYISVPFWLKAMVFHLSQELTAAKKTLGPRPETQAFVCVVALTFLSKYNSLRASFDVSAKTTLCGILEIVCLIVAKAAATTMKVTVAVRAMEARDLHIKTPRPLTSAPLASHLRMMSTKVNLILTCVITVLRNMALVLEAETGATKMSNLFQRP